MSQKVNHDPSDWAMPFAGLGFDLEAVAQYAAQLTLSLCVVVSGRDWHHVLQAPVSGYALQLRLGRETRAG